MKKNILSCIIPIAASVTIYSSQVYAVYNGVEVSPQDESYMVFLSTASGGTTCSGALIAPNTVLTAAYCAVDNMDAHFLYSVDNDGTKNGESKKVVKHYFANDLYTFDEPGQYYDIAILELEGTPNNVEFLPVAAGEIPLDAKVYPLGYSSGQLKKMPIPAKVAAKENSKAYYIEAYFSECPNSPNYSNNYYNQSSTKGDEARCNYLEWAFDNRREPISQTQYTISVENPSFPSSHLQYSLDESSGFVTKYGATRGDGGSPLIFDGKIYGVASTVTNIYSAPHNVATFYEGLGREGAFSWIVKTVKDIQTRVTRSEEEPKHREIIFPDNVTSAETDTNIAIVFPNN
ncbi:trypsin-like serine protease [Vibrio pectenicida]|uniref:trypsin-like serine protease n=1 Tax=Vibrio pectenicida TaxID=62763 RepID=UPI003B9B1CA0